MTCDGCFLKQDWSPWIEFAFGAACCEPDPACCPECEVNLRVGAWQDLAAHCLASSWRESVMPHFVKCMRKRFLLWSRKVSREFSRGQLRSPNRGAKTWVCRFVWRAPWVKRSQRDASPLFEAPYSGIGILFFAGFQAIGGNAYWFCQADEFELDYVSSKRPPVTAQALTDQLWERLMARSPSGNDVVACRGGVSFC